jgi:hypothetical protein
MESDNTPLVEVLFERTESYVKISAEVFKLKIIKKVSEVVSDLTSSFVVIVFATLFFLIFNIGVSLWLGELFGKMYLGFFTVAAFYLLSGILLYIFRRAWIKIPIRNAIIIKSLN